MHLLNHRYWTRVWIIQEIMYSRKLYIKCGGEMVTWQDVAEQFVKFFETDAHGMISYKSCINIERTFSKQLEDIIFNRDFWGFEEAWEPCKSSAGWVLKFYDKSECSNRRDLINGFRGLVKDLERLEVDYEISLVSCAWR